jgi:hypothetical protein
MHQAINSAFHRPTNCIQHFRRLSSTRRSSVSRRYSRATATAAAAAAPTTGMRTITNISDILGNFQVQNTIRMLVRVQQYRQVPAACSVGYSSSCSAAKVFCHMTCDEDTQIHFDLCVRTRILVAMYFLRQVIASVCCCAAANRSLCC